MARSNRPELVKDNPPAPQVYVRWRNRRKSGSRTRAGNAEDSALREVLRRVTEAAQAFVEATPESKRAAVQRRVLAAALSQAHKSLLSGER